MDSKQNIIKSWILVEKISEGDISLKDKKLKTFFDSRNEKKTYYDLFKDAIKNCKQKSLKNPGIIMFCNIFPFDDVIREMMKIYNIHYESGEFKNLHKFSFCVCFDNHLKLIDELTFVSTNYYLKKYKKIPDMEILDDFEQSIKKEVTNIFSNEEVSNFKDFFNNAMYEFIKKYDINLEDSRWKFVNNIEIDCNNLHSFYIKDLVLAEKSHSKMIDRYLFGNSKHIDLDSNDLSNKYSPDIFKKILQPKNFPLGRFPTNPSHALYFMQQVALNLITGYDDDYIRSVNGPPGTGKTTLLRDVFANSIVEQAYIIASSNIKTIKGMDDMKYYGHGTIGILPNNISDLGIMVASSNNAAVQNIVNEMPLYNSIDPTFHEELKKLDYFSDIYNEIESHSNREDDPKKSKSNTLKEYWGLFSMEGGKKSNINKIEFSIGRIIEIMQSYQNNEDIYKQFLNRYNELKNLRDRYQKAANKYSELLELKKILIEKNNSKNKYTSIFEDKLIKLSEKNSIRIDNYKSNIAAENEKLKDLSFEEKNLNIKIDFVDKGINALYLQKPRWYEISKNKKFRLKLKEYSDKKQGLILELEHINLNKNNINLIISKFNKKISQLEDEITNLKEEFKQWEDNITIEIQQIKEDIKEIQDYFKDSLIKPFEIDNSVSYSVLQKEQPWFNREFRIKQSLLFIEALKVRKQFIAYNLRNLKASYNIWHNKNTYLSKDKTKFLLAAWQWINFTIPVISSTFASIRSMFNGLGENSIGQLFIDEAGQALPQASVGALYRSKKALVVGDPAQIPPVITLDPKVLELIGKIYNVSTHYLSEMASTQTLTDATSKYGFYRDENRTEWIGIPLWVHRRCLRPMFDISNCISYNGNMVIAEDESGYAEWINVQGNAKDKYVKEQGDELVKQLTMQIRKNDDILDTSKEDVIFVITPFKNVAYELSKRLDEIKFTRYDEEGNATNVGTVHKFQGKEAPIVYLVLGADKESEGAANWAMGMNRSNIMNVAATRAKKEFYIIGDQKLYLGLNSNVINETYRLLEEISGYNHQDK